MHPRIPPVFGNPRDMTARQLWQCETMMRAFDRADAKEAFEAQALRDHRAAVAKSRR